jgi:hypothetical protein
MFLFQTDGPPVEENVRRARILRSSPGARLSHDESLGRLLSAYRDAIEATGRVMRRTGMVDTCSLCASGPWGSCCFEGVEQWYDEVLLLINLLLGARLPDRRQLPGHCFFLGSRGCALLGRHSFCINYLCPSLSRELDQEQKRQFLSIAGGEILSGWELERYLRQRLADAGEDV